MRLTVFILTLLPLCAISGNLDRIRKALEKNEFEKAVDLIHKTRSKEPQNPGIDYFSAVIFKHELYNERNLDSARFYINAANYHFSEINKEELAKLEDAGINEQKISELADEIMNLLFDKLILDITLEGVQKFIADYPNSPFDEKLTHKRDSIIFEEVQRQNTEEAYDQFLTAYPTSSFSNHARSHLDDIRFHQLQESTEIKDYINFIEYNPHTKYRLQVESFILRRITAGSQKEKFAEFIQLSNEDSLKKVAGDVLYYLEGSEGLVNIHPRYDSIKTVNGYNNTPVIASLKKDQIAFFRTDGIALFSDSYEDIDNKMKCNVIHDDWLMVKKHGYQIVDRSGSIVLEGLDEYENLGYGVAKVRFGEKWYLYHKSGFKILDHPIEDAEVLQQSWIRVKVKGKWGLISFLGYPVSEFRYEDIYAEGPFWVFEKLDRLAIYTTEQIRDDLNQKGLELEFKFDDLELIGKDKVIGFRENRECMMDEKLEFVIPWGNYDIIPASSGWYLLSQLGYQLYDHTKEDIMSDIHPYLESNYGWLALKTTDDWRLIPKFDSMQPSQGYDSLKLISDYCVYFEREGKQHLLFKGGITKEIGRGDQVMAFVEQPDYVLLKEGVSKTLVDSIGKKKFTINASELTFLSDSVLKVEIRGREGLLNLDGKFLIKAEYQSLNEKDGLVVCLKNGKIGCFDLKKNLFIPAQYEARIARIGENYLIKKSGYYGLIDRYKEEVVSAKYDEIHYWNDSTFLIKEGEGWFVIDKYEDKIGPQMTVMKKLLSNSDQSIWKYVSNGKYGLISDKNGILLPPEFSDIMNIGDEDSPLFFGDQHLKKAGFHVVSYIDEEGNLLMSQAHRSEYFDKILCD